MMKKLAKTAGMVFLLAWLAAFGLLLGKGALNSWQEAQLISAAKALRVSSDEGPTLAECIRSYYGEEGDWYVMPDGQVHLTARSGDRWVNMALCAGERQADIFRIANEEHFSLTRAECDQLLGSWVRSVRP